MFQPLYQPLAGHITLVPNAAYSPLSVVAHPNSGVHYPPVRLARLATLPGGVAHTQNSYWEERLDGTVRRTSIEKDFTLAWEPQANGRAVVTYAATTPPVLKKADLSDMEQIGLLLSGLYQRLELDASPAGELLALRNHAEVSQAWAGVRQELIRRSGGEDEITKQLITSLDALLQRPQALFASLSYDYAYGFLLPNVYQQRFESGFRYEQARQFPQFFADTDLWFQERLEVGAPAAPNRVTLALSGRLDTTRTDVAAVARHVDAARGAAAGSMAPNRFFSPAPAAPTDPAALRCAYDATYEFDAATGWPVALEASVRCRVGDDYCKEYFLRFEQRP